MSRSHEGLLKTAHIDVLMGGRLRQIRETLSLTQKQVGADLGMSASAVKKIEDGARMPASRLWQFCGRYGLDVADVFAGLPHDVGPLRAASLSNTATGVVEGAPFAQPADDPLVEAIMTAAAQLTPVERALALAAVRGIGSKILSKVSL